MVRLINEELAKEEFGEAFSAINLNATISWIRFILTDDKPNKNKQRIPTAEFPNLIKTGIYMPIKMAKGEIPDGHDDSEPLGVITNLKIDGDKVLGLAALWHRERPGDIELLKKLSADGTPINLSWEILYRNSIKDIDGVEELHDVTLRASTIVGRPAYAGRTLILAIAAKGSPAYLDELPDTAFLFVEETEKSKVRKFPFMDKDGILDKELLQESVEEINLAPIDSSLRDKLISDAEKLLNPVESDSSTEVNKLEELEMLKSELEAAKLELETAKAALETKDAELVATAEELSKLREFKASIEDDIAKKEKLASIKLKFSEAGISKEEAYFEENKEFLMSMEANALAFMIQELVSFASAKASELTAVSTVVIPNLQGTNEVPDMKSMVEFLRKRESK
jgi:hypothetical protein